MSDYLPEEVVLEILHRLPVKSLIRFRCVSKSWNSLITTSAFIKSHLTRSLSLSSDKLIVRQCVNKPYPFVEHYKLIDDTNDSSSDQIQHIDFPLRCSRFICHFNLIGSVNGLFSLFEEDRFVIWNPSIRKFITLPKPCIRVKSVVHEAFGFDPRTNDYKVVRIAFPRRTQSSEMAKIPLVEIYSLNEGSWRITSAGNSFSPGFSFVDRGRPSASLNGAVHFVVRDWDNKSDPSVLSFDLGDEVFRMISVPNGAFSTSDYVHTSVIGGSLSLLCHDSYTYGHAVNNCCSIWVMKEYGVVDSWTKQFTVNLNGGLLLGLQKNGNMLVETKLPLHCEISSYDPKSKQVKNLGICGMSYTFFVDNYMENLVLLDKPNDKVSKRRVSRKRKYSLIKVVSEKERRDKETSHELEKKMLHLEHDITILKAKVMEISTLKSEMAALKSQALRFVQQLSNQVQNMISSVGNVGSA
ncbi:F-box/kelch-repeat protein At3g23880-like [Quercus lobata]|uniref:F-box/kelch-repeat protein At3g23880-like n=1 Tax=Quercus lobata TaxID=97700 RepID=UPI001247F597|nr:F-box/kelch-repeat protein At3g23880-like [Quercus lobata]